MNNLSDELALFYDKIEKGVKTFDGTREEVYKRLDITRSGFAYMMNKRSMTITFFLNYCKTLELNPCSFFDDNSEDPIHNSENYLENVKHHDKGKVSDTLETYHVGLSKETLLSNENVHLRQQIRLLEQLADSYKKHLETIDTAKKFATN